MNGVAWSLKRVPEIPDVMPQTLLVLAGIVLASLVSISQTRSGHRTEGNLGRLAIQSAAADAASERLTFLGTLPFDEAVVTVRARIRALTDLTPVVNGVFVRTTGTDPAGNDLDDFNGVQTTVTPILREGGASHPLTVSVTVQYVSEADGTASSGIPTRFKRATVRVTAPGSDPVQLTQLFSCGGYCTW